MQVFGCLGEIWRGNVRPHRPTSTVTFRDSGLELYRRCGKSSRTSASRFCIKVWQMGNQSFGNLDVLSTRALTNTNVNRGWHPLFSQRKYQGMRPSGFSPSKMLSSRGHKAGWTPFIFTLNTHNYFRASLCEKNYSARLPRGTCLKSSSELVPLGYLTVRQDSQTLQSSRPSLRWRGSESL